MMVFFSPVLKYLVYFNLILYLWSLFIHNTDMPQHNPRIIGSELYARRAQLYAGGAHLYLRRILMSTIFA